MLLDQNDTPVGGDGQLEPTDRDSTLDLGYLAEVLLATEPQWTVFPEPDRLFGVEFLAAVLAKAANDR